MKNFITAILIIISFCANAQNVVISGSESTADPSAMLDVQSKNKGMLIPRLTITERLAINNPATGLIVYQTNDVTGFYYYDGAVWTAFVNTKEISHFGSGRVITGTERDSLKSALQTEVDPVFSAHVASNITNSGSNKVITTAERTLLNSSFIPVGTIISFAGDTSKIPDGWTICDGRPLLRNEYAALFAVISANWGVGDGLNTFNIPDLRGMFLRGTDLGSMNDPDSDSRFGGLSSDKVGSSQDDAFQGHWHEVRSKTSNMPITFPNGGVIGYSGDTPPNAPPIGAAEYQIAKNPIDDGTNGTPRTSSETRPKNAYVNYIIKY
ncbi:MAG: tail fiber protein [Cyclobacteriaceae bacterium]